MTPVLEEKKAQECTFHIYSTQKQMQNWLSNISDIPELTSKIAILGNYSCQGAADVLINHTILMFKTFLYTQVAFVALKHYIAYTQKIEQKMEN